MPDNEDQELQLEREIRAHFVDARGSAAVPPFESVLANAEAAVTAPRPWRTGLDRFFEAVRPRPLWAVATAAVLALVVVLLFEPEHQAETPSPSLASHLPLSASALEGELLASLGGSTRWQAPSDRWPAMKTNIDVYGLPEIGNSQILKE